jgi:hypothetical protein
MESISEEIEIEEWHGESKSSNNEIQNKTVPLSSFEEKINQLVELHKPHVYILTPCYGGVCSVNYLTCLFNTIKVFEKLKINVSVEFCQNDSLVTRARNNLIAKAMTNPNMTHVMFIDNDIVWEPMDVLKLFVANKGVIGGVYPLKKYNWEKLLVDPQNSYNTNVIGSWLEKKNKSILKEAISDLDFIKHRLLSYNVNLLSTQLQIQENLLQVRHVATGFMMIQRNVFERLIELYPETKYTDDIGYLSKEETKFAFGLFNTGVVDQHFLSEDFWFCDLWMKTATATSTTKSVLEQSASSKEEFETGSIWIDISISLIHQGTETFKGCYLSSLV